jgi:UDP-glucose 4-epimerase
MTTKNVLITGVTGFVGRSLLSELDRRHYKTVGIARSISSVEQGIRQQTDTKFIGEIHSETDWSDVLDGTDCVIHCAARAHVMNEGESDSLAAYRSVNVNGTERLAEAAAAAGVRRFIYLSSIKVNGEETSIQNGFSAYDNPAPLDPYGLSKWEAELALRKISDRT